MHSEAARGRGGFWLKLTVAIAIAYFSQVHPHVDHLHAHEDHHHQMDRPGSPQRDDRWCTDDHPKHDHDNDAILWLADRVRTRPEYKNLAAPTTPTTAACLRLGASYACNPSLECSGRVVLASLFLPDAIPITDLESRGPPSPV